MGIWESEKDMKQVLAYKKSHMTYLFVTKRPSLRGCTLLCIENKKSYETQYICTS